MKNVRMVTLTEAQNRVYVIAKRLEQMKTISNDNVSMHQKDLKDETFKNALRKKGNRLACFFTCSHLRLARPIWVTH